MNDKVAAPSDPPFNALVREAQICEHVDLIHYALATTFVGSLVIHTIYQQVFDPLWLLYVWLATINSVSLTRIVLVRQWHRHTARITCIDTWEWRIACHAGLAGTAWGAGGPLAVYYVEPTYQSLAPLLIVCVAAGGILFLARQPKAFAAFYLCLLLPNILFYIWRGQSVDLWTAFVLVTFTVTIISTGRLATRSLRQSTESRLQLAMALDAAKASRRLAENANQAKSQFLANMSHELRTPMHAILSFSELGANKTDDAKLSSYFERIRLSGERLLSLINDLLDLSKFEAGRMEINRVTQPVRPLVNTAVQEIEGLLIQHGLKVKITEPEPTTAALDELRFGQVIRNLLANAVRYSPPGSQIELGLMQEQDLLRLTISDQGTGIPDKDIETIFDEFVQSQPATNGHRGTGLGLAICRRIVKAHNGRIFARNRPEGGAEFVVEIPS